MKASDEDALICDLAETYGITDMRRIPVGILSALAAGLPDESRSMRKITGRRLTLTEELLAAILDGVNLLLWQRTKDGAYNRNRPESILEKLTEKPKEKDTVGFASGEDFERAKQAILKKVKHDAEGQ